MWRLLLACLGLVNIVATASPTNILLILADDLGFSDLGCYGSEIATPNLDALASDGVLFTRAHVQFAYCAPSRNSFMSGRRPDATKCYNFLNHFRDNAPGQTWSSLPEHFKRNGYLVTGTGKLFHRNLPPNFEDRSADIAPPNLSIPAFPSSPAATAEIRAPPSHLRLSCW